MLSESNIPRTAPSVSRKDEAAPPGITPEEAAKLIGFALSELSTENAHHEFEHLCRHLTRATFAQTSYPQLDLFRPVVIRERTLSRQCSKTC
jgi:hypothetical protein